MCNCKKFKCNKNEDGTVSYKVEETSVPENSGREYSIIVGYPESYAGKK